LTAKLGKQAKEHIDLNWNWDNYVAEILEVYKRVID